MRPDGDGPYRGKRAVDLAILAVTALPGLALGAVCALLVRVSSPGPIFFRQERIGLHGKPFRIWKFRTMADAPDNPVVPDPARITPVGRWLRRTSLDELPQLINVLFGEMSIVGPRPTLAYQVERYDARQRRRLAVRPGLTGLAQIRGRNKIDWSVRIQLDLEYLDRQSPLLDVVIVARTAGAVARTGGGGHRLDDPISADPFLATRGGKMP
jgi:lipopolysaccharide/colanic/teichoic acid biosynthesis glycosyltransferase